ncbi:helix-turn-helix transcriptional regulator [Amycolatopsis anabasis]|uniref:helix-turn-helix transcriptional regulator n=1 Tax=Amycolatopsis anabasis TaxID=1840409 RepID=UPI00131C2C9D|nr:WYL domain-containing protein [Amycolatopsis anabasis]
MLETSARLLRLLSLLQTRRDWATADLAERLEVAPRTVRRDMGRLRDLGYPVHATPGVAGGYRLGAGAVLPPLLLDDEEAVAVALSLRTAAAGTVAGLEETALRALSKLDQVLPSRLRRRVATLQSYTVPAPPAGPTVDANALTTIAAACRDTELLRFDYADHYGVTGLRTAEPHRLVYTGRRWYLVAWDIERSAWRSFRVDRIRPRTPNGPRFTPRELPGGDVAGFVSRGVAAALWRYRARVTVHAPATVVARRIPSTWLLEPLGDDRCLLDAGADSPRLLAVYLGALDLAFDASEHPELAEALRSLATRLTAAAG